MPLPNDFAERSGTVTIYRRRQADSTWTAMPDWTAASVELGSRDRISTATLRLNRDKVLRGTLTVTNPPQNVISQDDIWMIAFNPRKADGTLDNPTAIFEGTHKLLNRSLSGTPNASHDTTELLLQDSVVVWADDPINQVYGRHMADLKDRTIATGNAAGIIRHDGSLPCVFNSGGKPNRSRRTSTDTRLTPSGGGAPGPIFDNINSIDVHYFVDDDGWDVDEDPQAASRSPSNVGKTAWPAYYWTYAQAIAYVLNFHAGATAFAGSTVSIINNGVRMWFGFPPQNSVTGSARRVNEDPTTAWGAVIGPTRTAPIYKTIAASEDWANYTANDPVTGLPIFGSPDDPGQYAGPNVSAIKLLNARCHNLSIEGMNVIEALGSIIQAAGMGWWIDSYVPYTGTPTIDTVEHVFRVFTPGCRGTQNPQNQTWSLPDGIGDNFKLALQPSYTPTSGRTPADIFGKNNSDSLDASFDAGSIINAPIVLRSPTHYEVTCLLRPGWRPLNSTTGDDPNNPGHQITTAKNGLLDNINPNRNITDPNDTPKPEDQVAIADIMRALATPIANPHLYFQPGGLGFTGAIAQRIKTMFDVLHGKGLLSPFTADVLRKWIIPTDLSYPNKVFARDYATCAPFGMPWQYGDYTPVNWAPALDTNVANNPPPSWYTPNPDPAAQPPGSQDLPVPYEIDSNGARVQAFIINPIPKAGTWPTRRRRMLPCLTSDPNQESLGVIVEVSFNKGVDYVDSQNRKTTSWYKVDGFRVLRDELGIYFTHENPFDISNLHRESALANYPFLNLATAYISHSLRVRATFVIEASSNLVQHIQPDPHPGAYDDVTERADQLPDPAMVRRSRVLVRRDRYHKTVNLGQFKDRTTNQAAKLIDLNANALLSADLMHPADYLAPSYFWHFYRAVDQTAAARAELARQQAASGDWKISAKGSIPWIELNARPGRVVEYLDEGTGALPTGAIARNIDFRALAGPQQAIGPSLAGIIYRFTTGGMRTDFVLEDWRALSSLAPV